MSRRDGRDVVALLAVLVVSACSSHDNGSVSAASAASSPASRAASTAASSTSDAPITSTVPQEPHVDMSIATTTDGLTLNVLVRVRGFAPLPISSDPSDSGDPLPTTTDANGEISGEIAVLGTQNDFGDGSLPGGSNGGTVSCRPGMPLVPVIWDWPARDVPTFAHTYAHAGTYVFKYTMSFCELGDVSRSTEVTVG